MPSAAISDIVSGGVRAGCFRQSATARMSTTLVQRPVQYRVQPTLGTILGTRRMTMEFGTKARQRLLTSGVNWAAAFAAIAVLTLAFSGMAFAEDAGPPACGGKILEK